MQTHDFCWRLRLMVFGMFSKVCRRLCLEWGSNLRPWDYETHALPTALSRHNELTSFELTSNGHFATFCRVSSVVDQCLCLWLNACIWKPLRTTKVSSWRKPEIVISWSKNFSPDSNCVTPLSGFMDPTIFTRISLVLQTTSRIVFFHVRPTVGDLVSISQKGTFRNSSRLKMFFQWKIAPARVCTGRSFCWHAEQI